MPLPSIYLYLSLLKGMVALLIGIESLRSEFSILMFQVFSSQADTEWSRSGGWLVSV